MRYLIWVSLWSTLSIIGEANPCAEREADKLTIWEAVTPRTSEEIHSVLAKIDSEIRVSDFKFPTFDKSLAVENSILSLGEGNSTFVFQLLQNRKQKNVFAVDVASVEQAPLFAQHQQLWPNHYHRTTFQNLDLRDVHGRRIKFDEIISSNSLNFVLDGAPPGEAMAMFRKIWDHLKVGGVLRVWPDSPEATIWRYIFSELRARQIKFKVHSGDLSLEEGFLVVQKLGNSTNF